jgi:CoA:oxalate CoA-transferase
VEPPRGDDSRQFGPFVNGQSAYHISINRNKRSIVIDLKTARGRDVLRDLIETADVVLENFRPDTMEKLGFSYERLQEINPRIVYASICGFGHDALESYASRPAYDMVAQAFSGIMSITGPEDGPPVRVGTSIGDIVAGHQCAIAILSALWHRESTGRGQKIDMSMVDGLVYVLENAIVRYTVSGTVPRPLGTKHPSITPFQGFRTRDSWIVIPIGNDGLWERFCKAIGKIELAQDERFITNARRTQNRSELSDILESVTQTRTTAEWIELLEQQGLPCSPVNNIEQVVGDANINYRGMISEVDQPDAGKIRIAGSPFHLSETPGRIRSPAPLLGQHTREVLRDVLRYPAARIESLIADRVVISAD